MTTVSVIIPTYNEAENVPLLLEQLGRALSGCGADYELIIVDDDSPDETWRVAEACQRQDPRVRVIRRTGGVKGLAPSVVDGWRQARGELLGVIDADLQHPPEVLATLVRVFEDPSVDVAVASRYTSNGVRLRWNPVRKWISRGASNLAQAVLPSAAHGVTDPMSGFFVLRRRVVEDAALRPTGYKILLEVLGRGRYRRVAEVPYQFGRRRRGESKLGALVMRDYLAQVWRLVWAPEGMGRFVRFCLVGAAGVVVNLGIFWWLKASGMLGTLRAGAVAVECAILNNFLWNELWTFKDRSQGAPRLADRLRRLAHFNLICGVGAAIQLALLWALSIRLGWHYLVSNAIAIGLVTFWNYGLNTTWTWTRLAGTPTAIGRPAISGWRQLRWFLVLLGVWLALQAWMVQVHWVNADEGAHLMDARLAMAGLVPEVDFHARQPLYVYAYVPFLALFGGGLSAGRWMPVLATALTAWVLWLFGRRLWSTAAGLIAAALFLYTPTIFINAAVVKTEPLAMLLTALGLYGVVAHLQDRRRWPLVLAGAALGAGYYVRESTLAGLPAAALLLFLECGGLRAWLRRAGRLALGYGGVVAAVLLAYAPLVPASELFSRWSLSPVAAVTASLGRIFGWMPRAEAAGAAVRQSSQPWFETMDRLYDVVRLNLYFGIGLVIAAALWWRASRRPSAAQPSGQRLGLRAAFAWLGCVAFLYSYHVASRGFFQYYFRELIPPLALLTGFSVAWLFGPDSRLRVTAARYGLLALALGAAAWLAEHAGWKTSMPLALAAIGASGRLAARAGRGSTAVQARYGLGYLLCAALLLLARFTPLAGGPYPKLGLLFVAIGLAAALGLVWGLARTRLAVGQAAALGALSAALVLAAAYAGQVVDRSYDCEWPPAMVARAAQVVAAHSAPQGEVLSGTVIWEFAAHRQPFLRISHPLGFMEEMSAPERSRIARRLAEDPPAVIVMDRYTPLTYGRHLALAPVLASSYHLVGEFTDAPWPVRVYARGASE